MNFPIKFTLGRNWLVKILELNHGDYFESKKNEKRRPNLDGHKYGEKFHAGVAFFEERFGEYRMILDAPRTVLYLRPQKSENDRITYTVHAPIEKNGKFAARVQIGHGYSDEGTNGQVYMKIGRYLPQRLVLIPEETEVEKALLTA